MHVYMQIAIYWLDPPNTGAERPADVRLAQTATECRPWSRFACKYAGMEGAVCQWHTFSTDRSGAVDFVGLRKLRSNEAIRSIS